jgi:hypothetical protein
MLNNFPPLFFKKLILRCFFACIHASMAHPVKSNEKIPAISGNKKKSKSLPTEISKTIPFVG